MSWYKDRDFPELKREVQNEPAEILAIILDPAQLGRVIEAHNEAVHSLNNDKNKLISEYLSEIKNLQARLRLATTTIEHAYNYVKDFDCEKRCDAMVNHHEPECCLERDFFKALKVIGGGEG